MVAMPLFGLKKGGKTMRKYLYSENGFVEKAEWKPNCWVNVECPDDSDFQFLTQELKVPESFLEDIADTDERPRTETEGNWLLTILRIPMQSNQHGIPFITVPIGIITNNDIIVSVCYHHTELIPDFIQHTRRKGIVVNNKLTLILRIIYSSAVWFLKYLKQINNDVATAEKELEKSIRNEDLLQLMKLQKTLEPFHYPDDTYVDSQFLRYERGYTPGRISTCVCVHCAAVRNIIGRDLYMVQKDQMVLKIRVGYRHQYFNTFADTVLYLGIVIPIEAPI